jgi:hypothetical protein
VNAVFDGENAINPFKQFHWSWAASLTAGGEKVLRGEVIKNLENSSLFENSKYQILDIMRTI